MYKITNINEDIAVTYFLLSLFVSIQIVSLSLGIISESGGALMWYSLSLLACPITIAQDYRNFEFTQSKLNPRGVLWVIGSLIPILSASVCVIYLLRKYEIIEKNGTWAVWPIPVVLSITIIFFSIVAMLIFDNPNTADTTALQDLGVLFLVIVTPMPGLAAYFDLDYLKFSGEYDFPIYNWLWVPGLLIWSIQFIVFIGWIIWRVRIASTDRMDQTLSIASGTIGAIIFQLYYGRNTGPSMINKGMDWVRRCSFKMSDEDDSMQENQEQVTVLSDEDDDQSNATGRNFDHPQLETTLQEAERAFQEGIIAYIDDDLTLSRTRFRQSRNKFESASSNVENDEDGFPGDGVTLNIKTDRKLDSSDLSEILDNEEMVSTLNRWNFYEIDDIEVDTPSRVKPVLVDKLKNREIGNKQTRAKITVMSWLENGNVCEIPDIDFIETRTEQANHGFKIIQLI
jgi:hypothetical protein